MRRRHNSAELSVRNWGAEVVRVTRTTNSPRLRARDAADPSDPSRLVPGPPREAHRARGACRHDHIGAVAQHGRRVAPVTRWLQRQGMRVLEPVDRPLDASEQRRLVRDCPCPRAASLLVHRATLRHAACGHPLDISYSNGHSTTLYESALARLRFSGVLRGERRLQAFLRDRANPVRWTLSRECAPRGHSGQRRVRVDLTHAAPRSPQRSRFPVRQVAGRGGELEG